MASATIAKPALTPASKSSRRSAARTSNPSPPAPIIEAMMTMLSESMMTWLTPTISASCALGSSTRQVCCRRVQPIIRPRSCTSDGTRFSASSVIRVIGGIA
jgi:hypothetical protein